MAAVNMKLPAHLLLGAAAAALLALPAGHGQHADPDPRAHAVPAGYGHHARHEELPHSDPPEFDPTPLETASYSVTGTAAPGYAFRLRLPDEK